jgi:hypothetical protein
MCLLSRAMSHTWFVSKRSYSFRIFFLAGTPSAIKKQMKTNNRSVIYKLSEAASDLRALDVRDGQDLS